MGRTRRRIKKENILKKSIFLALIFSMLVGCTPTEKKNDAPPTPQSPDTAAAPKTQSESSKDIVNNYEKTLVTSIDRAKGAQAKVDLGAIQDAVRNFQVENGKYPDSLDAVKGFLRPGTDLSAFNYDAGSGMVSLK